MQRIALQAVAVSIVYALLFRPFGIVHLVVKALLRIRDGDAFAVFGCALVGLLIGNHARNAGAIVAHALPVRVPDDGAKHQENPDGEREDERPTGRIVLTNVESAVIVFKRGIIPPVVPMSPHGIILRIGSQS